MVSSTVALVFAIISPIIYGSMNIVGKYAFARRIKSVLGYFPLSGIASILTGVILSFFLNWSGIKTADLLFPAATGILYGVAAFLYYFALKDEDVSYTVGLIYIYPLFVALLSFFFLKETLPATGYAGMILVIAGAVALSVRLRKIKLMSSVWLLSGLVLFVALNEFMIKISTLHVPELNGAAVTNVFIGITLFSSLAHKKTRSEFFGEIKNINWAFLEEVLSFMAIITLYVAMSALPAPTVSSIAAIQPLVVIVLERIVNGYVGKISRDNLLLPKLVPILLIVAGVVLLSAFGVT